MGRVSRRGLLRGAAGLMAGYAASRFLPNDLMSLYADTLDTPAVVVAQGTNEDTPERLLRASLAPLGGIERFVKPGQTVCIKPNATWANKPHTASSTDPDLLRALIEMVKAAGARRIIVVDRCTIDPPAMTLGESGIGKVLDETGVEWEMHDLNGGPPGTYIEVDVPRGKEFKRLGIIKQAALADVRINMAVAKSHLVVPVTLCCKHMMGFLRYPPEIHGDASAYLDQGIADIGTIKELKCDLHILEAIRVRVDIRSYGDGTDITDPARVKRRNQLIVGTDPVLIDAYAATTFFNRSPMEITHIKRCFESGIGEIDVQKAMSAGRMRTFSVVEALRPTITPTPTEPAPGEQILTPTPRAVATPTKIFVPASRSAGSDTVVNLGPMFDGVLVPMAAVIGGVGLVVGRRVAGSLRRQGPGADDAGPGGGPGPSPQDAPGPEGAAEPPTSRRVTRSAAKPTIDGPPDSSLPAEEPQLELVGEVAGVSKAARAPRARAKPTPTTEGEPAKPRTRRRKAQAVKPEGGDDR